jgi:hypothetical protein
MSRLQAIQSDAATGKAKELLDAVPSVPTSLRQV